AFGKEAREFGQRGKPRELQAVSHDGTGLERNRLNREASQMLLEAGSPNGKHQIAGLEDRPHGARPPATDESEPPPPFRSQNVGNDAGFPVPAQAEDYALFPPLHFPGSF